MALWYRTLFLSSTYRERQTQQTATIIIVIIMHAFFNHKWVFSMLLIAMSYLSYPRIRSWQMWCVPKSHLHLICLKSEPPSLIKMKAQTEAFLYLLHQWTSRLIQEGIICTDCRVTTHVINSQVRWLSFRGPVELQNGPAISPNSQSH